ncbi:hypothetical protein NCLIV_068610 [Neospora caninum Liverpool]|uniref:F-box domain-containing protein n=1 Tax=Neospora caninum (strain Liverpool) TaxID=572307 RepID=F0VRT9_NEOCL|nr:hypothetical protein NCLIV_068610 [Neospora caninum Liverpool]CBZ56437.1 hypothetical protein NCLIV_068610 [Neospora caninum Liverpool]CEL71196.1 TPA: hypothetical protein BN1204_068610 [Neospora caninum Liverpool]|eukprot:XP_003886462.1 hypothetical protein NCLIV_068610 [Neospora caninum Liverpool]
MPKPPSVSHCVFLPGGSRLHDSTAFGPLGPQWWGYILAAYLPPSSLFTIKQVSKAWNSLTTSRYYTLHAPLRITETILNQLACATSALSTRQKARMARYLSLHCGDSITIGVARDSEAIHDVTPRILNATGPVKRMAISIDTPYVLIAKSLHRLFLRSVDTLLDMKLRGVRVSQQLNSICAEKQRTVPWISSHIELPRLQILEVDDVSLLKHLVAPKLLSLFVDYASASEGSDTGNQESEEDAHCLSPVLSRVARGILLAFLSRSGTHLEILTQADILPILFRSTPPINSPIKRADGSTITVMSPVVCLPNLTSLAVSDIHLLLYIRTINLESLTASVPDVSALSFFSRFHSTQLQYLEITQPSNTAANTSHSGVMEASDGSRHLRIPQLTGASSTGGRGILRHNSSPVSTIACGRSMGRRFVNEQCSCTLISPKIQGTGLEIDRRRSRNDRAFSLPCQAGKASPPADALRQKIHDWNLETPTTSEPTEKCLPQTDLSFGLLRGHFSNKRAEALNVFLPLLLELTVPGSFLAYLFCPRLQRVLVTGLSHRKQVLSFIQDGAPLVEELIVDNIAGAASGQRSSQPPNSQSHAGGFGEMEHHGMAKMMASNTSTPYITKPIPQWRLPSLRTYKGPAGLLDLDLECPNLERLEVRLLPIPSGKQ